MKQVMSLECKTFTILADNSALTDAGHNIHNTYYLSINFQCYPVTIDENQNFTTSDTTDYTYIGMHLITDYSVMHVITTYQHSFIQKHS